MENRFEGVTLTGKRVIFLIDMSGSMELIDANTTAPNSELDGVGVLFKLFRELAGPQDAVMLLRQTVCRWATAASTRPATPANALRRP